jgi:hypothetical protein
VKKLSILQEDLRKWFSKTDPGGDWKRINTKGEVVGPCAREPGEPKPKCMSRAKREALTKKERASAVRAKRKHDPDPERKGSPINVSNFGKGKISEDMENLNEKNVPTNPELWSRAKSLARSKFDVYPSAYANGWASKWYKGKGGSWKSVSEAKEIGDDPINDGTPSELRKRGNKTVITSDEIKEAVKDKFDIGEYDQEGDMAKSDLRSIMANAQKLHDMIEDADNLPEWCQNKITLAEDYISTVANYLTAEMSESDVYGKPTTEKTPTVTLKHKTSGKEIVVVKSAAPGYKKIGYHVSEEFSKTGKEATHNKTGEKTYEYAKVDKEGRKTGEREYRNAQGKPMGEEFAGYIAHYNGQKHEIKSHEAKDLYDAKQKAIAHFKIPKSKHGLLSVKPGVNEDVEQIDELNKNTLKSYIGKATKDVIERKRQETIAVNRSNQPRYQGKYAQRSALRTAQAYKEKARNRAVGIGKAAAKLAEKVEQIDELSKGLVARYANKVAKTTQANYDKSKDKFQFSSNRQDGMKNAVKRLTKEETQIDEISRDLADRYVSKVTQQQVQKQGMQPNMYDKLPKNRQQGVSNALKRTLVKSPVKEETIEEQLYKQGRFVTGAGKKPFKGPTLASPRVEESRGHKVLATFMKNREVAQRAFTGQNKPVEKPKEEKPVKESRKAEIVKNIMRKKKSDTFEAEPELSNTQSKSDQTL